MTAGNDRGLTVLGRTPGVWVARHGDVIILYSNFHVGLVGPKGEKQDTLGRGTEIFVKRNGKWIHTGWHLDKVKFS